MQNKRKDIILSVKNLRVSFYTDQGILKAVRGVSFDLYKGRTLAIVGESGSGKSQTSRAIMGLLANNSIVEEGEIFYEGKDLLSLKEEELCLLRGSSIAMIFQDPMSSLNPLVKVGKQIIEAIAIKKKRQISVNKRRLKFFKKTFLKDSKDKKAALLQAIKGERIEEETLLSIVTRSVYRNENLIQGNAKALQKELARFYSENRLLPKEVFFSKLKKEIPALKKRIEGVKNYLNEEKDCAVFTFITSLYRNLNLYKDAIKREKNLAKEALKEEKRLQKGKNKCKPNSAAWNSEIGASSIIHSRTLDYLSSFNKHLEKHYINCRIDVARKAQQVLGSFLITIQKAKEQINKDEFKNKAINLLKEVGISEAEKRMKQYPFELSGGMRQRIVISIALSSDPEILICDEPTTALDVSVQAEILDLINRLKRKRNLSVIFITHNMGVVARVADDIAIVYAGKIVEKGTAEEIFYDPRHPYSWALLSSVPNLETKDRLESIPGIPPNMIYPPKGDAFASRNKYAMKIDFEEEPPFFAVSKTHHAATWLLDPRAPKIETPKLVKKRIAHFKNLLERKTKRKEKTDGKKQNDSPKKQKGTKEKRASSFN